MNPLNRARRDLVWTGLAVAAAAVTGALTTYSLSVVSAAPVSPDTALSQGSGGYDLDCWDAPGLGGFGSLALPNLVSFHSGPNHVQGVPDPCEGDGGDGGNGGNGGDGGGDGGGGGTTTTTTTTIPTVEPVTFKYFAAYGWLDADFAYNAPPAHSASDFEVTATCNGVAATNNVDSLDCTSMQIVVEYGLLGASFTKLGYPAMPGRNAWQHIYSGPGLSCTETVTAATSSTAGKSTFDCTPTGTETSTYFMVIGLQTAWDFNIWTVNQGFVINHNLHTIAAVSSATWSSGTVDDWTPANLGGTSGLKACKVVSSVVTADCVTFNPSTFWVDGYNQYLAEGSVTWEFSLLDTSKTLETYPLFILNRSTFVASHQGTVTSTNTVQVTSSGNSMLMMLYRGLIP